jgi:16S rRNA processing protein RimM
VPREDGKQATWLRAGSVGRPHGLDGSFLVKDANPVLLALGAPVTVGGVQRVIERRAGHDGRLILRLEGCDTREGAERLRGEDLLYERAEAPELSQDEWWAEDLEGLVVRDGEVVIGTVLRLVALPSCEVLEVGRVAGGEPLLVPLVSDAVRVVDLEGGQIDVDLRFLGEA